MAEAIDLLSAYAAPDVVVAGRATDVSCAMLSAQVLRVAGALEPRRRVIVAAGDRLASLVCFLAAARAGLPVAFPASLKLESVRELEEESGGLVLHDQDLPAGVDVRPLLAGPPLERTLEVVVRPEQALAIFHTSGSTGAPTAHAKTAAHLVLEADMHVRRLSLSRRDCVLATVPTHHLYGFLFGALVPLRAGARVVLDTKVAPSAVASQAIARGATMLVSVPAHLRAITALAPSALAGRFRHVVSSGAPLDRADARAVEAALGVAAEEVLGSTETGGIATRRFPAEGFRPLPGVRAEVREGSLYVSSPYFAPGAEAFFATADRARPEPGGGFTLLGRSDDVVKVGGKRVSAREVEARLRGIPGVRDAFVRAEASTAARGARLAALVEGDDLDPVALRAELARHLDETVVPRRLVVSSSIPRTAAGKVADATVRALLFPASPTASLALRPREGEADAFDVHVPASLAVFEGHFAGDALLPGVVQLRDLVLAATRASYPELSSPSRLTRVKFKSPIRPGADLVVVLRRADLRTVRFRITERAGECASGTLHFDPS